MITLGLTDSELRFRLAFFDRRIAELEAEIPHDARVRSTAYLGALERLGFYERVREDILRKLQVPSPDEENV